MQGRWYVLWEYRYQYHYIGGATAEAVTGERLGRKALRLLYIISPGALPSVKQGVASFLSFRNTYKT